MVIFLCSNKHMIKRVLTMQLFVFTDIPNNITDVFLTDVTFLYTINGVHDNSISLSNGS